MRRPSGKQWGNAIKIPSGGGGSEIATLHLDRPAQLLVIVNIDPGPVALLRITAELGIRRGMLDRVVIASGSIVMCQTLILSVRAFAAAVPVDQRVSAVVVPLTYCEEIPRPDQFEEDVSELDYHQ